MAQGKAEDAGGLTPAKDDNTALCHFGHRTLPIFKCVDYKGGPQPLSGRGWHGGAVAGGIPFIDGLPEHGIPPPPPSAAVPLPLAREALELSCTAEKVQSDLFLSPPAAHKAARYQ